MLKQALSMTALIMREQALRKFSEAAQLKDIQAYCNVCPCTYHKCQTVCICSISICNVCSSTYLAVKLDQGFTQE